MINFNYECDTIRRRNEVPDIFYTSNLHQSISKITNNKTNSKLEKNINLKKELYDLQDILTRFNKVIPDFLYSINSLQELILYNQDIVIHLNIKSTSSEFITLNMIIYGYSSKCIEVSNLIDKNFEDIKFESSICKVNWYYKTTDYINSVYIHEEFNDITHDSAYPYIENISNYVSSYDETEERLLMLMGEPGTGKTRFIRFLIKKFKEKYDDMAVSYSFDNKCLEDNQLFIEFLSDPETRILVLEDIDFHLQDRKNDNPTMYKLLAATDGLLTRQNKKIIISTNHITTDNIDDALIRPGRCFDIIKTRNLTKDESIIFLKDTGNLNLSDKLSKDSYSLSELYRLIKTGKESIRKVKKVGF